MIIRAFLFALLAAVAACEKGVSAAGAEDGGRLFAATCARCHGADGTGGPAVAPGMQSPRNFRDPIFHTARTDDDIRHVITNGKGTAMPAFGAVFKKHEIDALLAHIRTLDPRR